MSIWIADILCNKCFNQISLRNSVVKAFKDDKMIHSGSSVQATVFLGNAIGSSLVTRLFDVPRR